MLGNNVEAKIENGVLTLTVDLGVDGSTSKSGKSVILGSTQGNKKLSAVIDGSEVEVTVGLNVYKSAGA